jgi:tRNA(Ile2) C34 agmatinyltransferase TiaS
MDASHRKVPNRIRELRQRVQELVRARIGTGIICPRCGATFASYGDKCEAAFDERCPGFNAVDLVQMRAEKEVGLT